MQQMYLEALLVSDSHEVHKLRPLNILNGHTVGGLQTNAASAEMTKSVQSMHSFITFNKFK